MRTSSLAYEGYEKEAEIISGIGFVTYEIDRIPEYTAFLMLEKNQEQLKKLPKVAELARAIAKFGYTSI